jgi:RNA-directed DNA polymerase
MSPLELRRLWYLDGRKMALWSEPSRRRLRRETQAISQSLAPHIPRSCTHVRGHGGVKGALRQIQRRMSKARFVARFDIAAYYTSMRHDVIEAQVAATDLDAHQRGLIADYLALPDSQGAGVGMVASGGLSPLLGALYLTPLDRRMDRLCKRKKLVHYVRYMDDIVLLARTRWQLRRAIAALHEEIAALGLHLHRVKRFIGRTTQGFDFLGYRIRAGARLRPSAEGLRRLRERARRLYEQGADTRRLRQYVLRWWWWLLGGLDGIVSRKGGVRRIERLVFYWLDIHPRRGTVAAGGA